MNPEPRQRDDYSPRQVGAARRVLVDLGQVLAAFEDCLVVVGGWVPDLLLEQADEPHVGSIDVDLALDADKLADGRYADLLKLLNDDLFIGGLSKVPYEAGSKARHTAL